MNQLRISQSASQLCRVILKLCICWCLQLFFLERKVMTNLDKILKSRDNFTNKGQYSQSYGFSSSHVWMWAINYKKAECQRIDAFELWCWKRLLRVPWSAKRSNQSILKEINPAYSWKGWCWSWSSNTLVTRWLIIKDPNAGKESGGEGD